MEPYALDERLASDSQSLAHLELCDVRLARDSRWPWVILVPRRPDVSEIYDLSEEDQSLLTKEQVHVAKALKAITGADKINIAAIGNVVRQLHVHVVARFEGDENWPRPIWGHGTPVPHTDETFNQMANKLRGLLQ